MLWKFHSVYSEHVWSENVEKPKKISIEKSLVFRLVKKSEKKKKEFLNENLLSLNKIEILIFSVVNFSLNFFHYSESVMF